MHRGNIPITNTKICAGGKRNEGVCEVNCYLFIEFLRRCSIKQLLKWKTKQQNLHDVVLVNKSGALDLQIKKLFPAWIYEGISGLVLHNAFKAQFHLNLKQMFFESIQA